MIFTLTPILRQLQEPGTRLAGQEARIKLHEDHAAMGRRRPRTTQRTADQAERVDEQRLTLLRMARR